MSSHGWRDDSACRALDLVESDRVFYPKSYSVTKCADALLFCGGCVVQVECLDDALQGERRAGPEIRFGVMGGMLPKERWSLDTEAVRLSASMARPKAA